MADNSVGMPTAAMLITYLDGLATVFKTNRAAFDTLLTSATNYRGSISTIGHGLLEQSSQAHRDQKVQQARYENFWKAGDFSIIQDLQNVITGSLPGGWAFGGTLLPLNGWLTRINGNSGIATPTNPIALTAANGGGLSSTTLGNAPRVCFTHIGTAGRMYESLPSAESTQVALTGPQGSYTGTITGVVPAGIGKIGVYRGLPGVATGTWYWDQDLAVSPGGSYPAIIIQRPDALLPLTIQPPSWISAIMVPELAYIVGLINANANPNKGDDLAPYLMTTTGMLSATNTALGLTSGWIGKGNSVASTQFGTKILPAAYTIGAIQTTNVPTNNVQGFFGGCNGLQVRASTQLNGTYSSTITYTYLNAANPITPQTQVGIALSSNFVGGIPNETQTYSIPAGRVVLTVTETATGGTATTGTLVWESPAIRAY